MDIEPSRDPGMSPGLHGERRVPEVSARGADLFVRGKGGPIRLLAHFPAANAERAPLLVLFTAAEADTDHDLDCLAETVSRRAAAVVLVSTAPHPAAGEVTVGLDAAATILDWAADHADQLRADADHLVVAGLRAAACLVVSLIAGALPEFRPTVRDLVLINPPRDCLAGPEASAGTATWNCVAPITVVLPSQRSVVDVAGLQEHHAWLSERVIYSDDAASTLIDLVTHRRAKVCTTPEDIQPPDRRTTAT
jgi:hypothetical protein